MKGDAIDKMFGNAHWPHGAVRVTAANPLPSGFKGKGILVWSEITMAQDFVVEGETLLASGETGDAGIYAPFDINDTFVVSAGIAFVGRVKP